MIRFSTATNPLGLELGERIKVKRVCKVDYDEDGNRKLFFTPKHENDPWVNDGKMKMTPVACRVIGSVKKALGQYQKGFMSFDGSSCDEPPSLKVSKYVRLYECREAIDTKSFLVHPNDIETLEEQCQRTTASSTTSSDSKPNLNPRNS